MMGGDFNSAGIWPDKAFKGAGGEKSQTMEEPFRVVMSIELYVSKRKNNDTGRTLPIVLVGT